MPVRYRYGEPPRRRFEHAHRIRQPVGPPDPRSAPAIDRPRHGIRPGAASLLALAIVATLALALRPWDGTAGSVSEDRTAGDAAAASTAPGRLVGGAAATPELRPHGDLVGTGAMKDGDIAHRGDVAAAHAARLFPTAMLSGYHWPIENARITNSYGLGRPGSFVVDGTTFHDGLDISSFCGAHVTAAHDGVVLGAGRRTERLLGWVGDLTDFRAKLDEEDWWGGQAITVVIDDGNGYRSVYAHLGLAVVDAGETVRAGDLLGYEGASGNATGCHLHYALFTTREEATLALDPRIARKTKLPPLEIARIDPLLVLPPLEAGGITWGWGAR